MRLELRASGGTACKTCGSYELLHEAGTDHKQFVTDITTLLAGENNKNELDAMAVVHAKCDQLKADVNKQVLILQHDVTAIYRDELHAIKACLDDYLSEDINRLRFLKRRYRDRIRADLEAMVDVLLSRTHLTG